MHKPNTWDIRAGFTRAVLAGKEVEEGKAHHSSGTIVRQGVTDLMGRAELLDLRRLASATAAARTFC